MRYNLPILLLLMAFSACGADSSDRNTRLPEPALDHSPLTPRFMVVGEKSAGNICIDEPASPLCAVDEFIMCWIDAPAHDCGNRPLSLTHDWAAWEALGHADSIEYSVVSVHRFSAEDLKQKRPNAHRFPVGAVEVVLKQRLTPDRQGPPKWRTGYYILVPDMGEWRMLSYFSTPWPDPAITERRWMSQGESSSSCIGDTSDPICSVETLIACWLRRDGELCRKVIDCEKGETAAALCLLPDSRMPRMSATLPWPRYSIEYFVVLARKSERTDLGPPGAPLMEVWVEQFFLGPEGNQYRLVPEYSPPEFLPAPGPGYWVAYVDGRWLVAGWGGELGD